MLRWICEASAQADSLLVTALVYNSESVVLCAAAAGAGIDVLFIIIFLVTSIASQFR
jgi:hypothetical protein